jgi:Ca2+/Na+ antiporter
MELGEISTGTSLLGKILKFVIFIIIIWFLAFELHLIGFGLLDLLGIEHSFQIENPNGFEKIYNGFLKIINKMILSSGKLGVITIIILIFSIYYIAYNFTKIRIFPQVIIKVLMNHLLILLGLGLLLGLVGKSTFWDIIKGVLMASIVGYAIYLYYRNKQKEPGEQQTKARPKNKEENTENILLFETNKGQISLKNPYRGIYIQGGAGSGKSGSLFEPIIKQIGEKDFTGILYDFKSPELTNKVFSSYQNSKISVKNVDFKNPYFSERINPINPKYLTKSVVAIEYAQVLINNLLPETIKKPDYWSNNAKMILAGIIWYLRNNHPDKCTLPHVISLLLHNSAETIIKKISFDYEASGMISSLRESIERGSEKTVAGMLSTLQNGLSTLNSQDIFWILSQDDFELNLNNKNNPTFLCVGNDSTLPEVYRPVISLIITVALKQMNKPEQEKSILLLDEAPTIYIPNIEQIPAVGRSNKIATVFGVQDYSQLSDKYGDDKAQVIVSNLGNQFFGRVVNVKSAEIVQKMFSKTDKVFVSKNSGTGTSGQLVHMNSNTNTGTSENVQERDRVKVSDLIHLESGEFYGIIAEGEPREILKAQFDYSPIENHHINQRIPINDSIVKENYFRIVKEAKEILNN